MKTFVLIFFITLSASAGETLIVKKRLPLSNSEIKAAQSKDSLLSDEVVPFDDSYIVRMNAYHDVKNRSRMVNGARNGGGMGVPLMIPILWGTFD